MRRFALLVLLALAFATPAGAQPNVLLIVTDDQRWDTLRYMPTVQAELQARGVTFRNAFAVNPVCCPSRASILTGQWSHTTGVWGIDGDHGGFHAFRDGSTLPVWLNAVGYRTGLVGKYLNGYTSSEYVPAGWDEWFATTLRPSAHFDYGVTTGSSALWFGTAPEEYATDVLARRATQFIRESGPEPFFLYFAPKAPHTPYVPAPRHADRFEGIPAWRPPSFNENDVSDKPAHIRNRAKMPAGGLDEDRERQLEMLQAVDDGVRDLLAALAETGKLHDTLIVFTSDNGLGWGEHRRAHKIVPYEESIRVPLVVRWDALGLEARRDGRFALNVDLAETIAAAAGVAVNTEGRNLLPLLAGEQTGWRSSFLIEARMRPKWGVPAYCGIRGQRWKYVQYDTGEEELYNLGRDPYELESKHRARPALLIDFRKRVRGSACRPPGFHPLRSCTRTGTAGRDRLRGTPRRDWVCAGRGRDRINVRRGGRDVVRCGSSLDRVRADPRDVLIRCERRSRRRIP